MIIWFFNWVESVIRRRFLGESSLVSLAGLFFNHTAVSLASLTYKRYLRLLVISAHYFMTS